MHAEYGTRTRYKVGISIRRFCNFWGFKTKMENVIEMLPKVLQIACFDMVISS